MSWTEHGAPTGDITTFDHIPLWTLKGDNFQYVAEQAGVEMRGGDILIPIKFRFDNSVNYIVCNCTGSNATAIFQVTQGSFHKEVSNVVTTEETFNLQLNTKDVGFSSGEATLYVRARGNFVMEVNYITAFTLTGWTENTATVGDWTEHTVS